MSSLVKNSIAFDSLTFQRQEIKLDIDGQNKPAKKVQISDKEFEEGESIINIMRFRLEL